MTTTFLRRDKQTNESNVLMFDQAVDQFILDNLNYAQLEDGITPEEALSDMATVFETRSALDGNDELDAGYFIYAKNK